MVAKRVVEEGAGEKAKRVVQALAVLREEVKVPRGGATAILVEVEILDYLLEAHDAFPPLLDGLAEDVDKLGDALRQASALLKAK